MSEWLKAKTQETPIAGKDVEEKKASCAVGWKVNWYSHCRKHFGGLEKTKERIN